MPHLLSRAGMEGLQSVKGLLGSLEDKGKGGCGCRVKGFGDFAFQLITRVPKTGIAGK